jgi:hypothetical protein
MKKYGQNNQTMVKCINAECVFVRYYLAPSVLRPLRRVVHRVPKALHFIRRPISCLVHGGAKLGLVAFKAGGGSPDTSNLFRDLKPISASICQSLGVHAREVVSTHTKTSCIIRSEQQAPPHRHPYQRPVHPKRDGSLISSL